MPLPDKWVSFIHPIALCTEPTPHLCGQSPGSPKCGKREAFVETEEGQGLLASVQNTCHVPNLKRLIVLWAPDLGSVELKINALN